MKNEVQILELVIAHFDKRAEEIIVLFERSTDFMEVCQDYIFCKKAIEQLEIEKGTKKAKELESLKSELIELKNELLSKL